MGFHEIHWDFCGRELSSLLAMVGALFQWDLCETEPSSLIVMAGELVRQQPCRYLATSLVVPAGCLQGVVLWWLRIGRFLIVDGSQSGEVLE